MGERAKIYEEVMGARIKDIQMPDEFVYNTDRLVESSRDKNNTISITLDNGEILLIGGYIKLSDE